MKKLAEYENGNAFITIYDNGTRIIKTKGIEKPNLDFPLSIDLCITNYCNRGCLFCYANSGINGKHADIMNLKIIDSIKPGTEIAIGGGSATSHPDLKKFLIKLKNKGIIANMTVSQGEFIDNLNFINELIEEDLIHGLGISFKEKNDILWKAVAENQNCVVHLIAGVHGEDVYEYLSKFGLKILILGYKDVGRGQYYHEAMGDAIDKEIEKLKNNLPKYLDKFETISFDNLSILQLNPKTLVGEKEWNKLYQGDDGTISCYINAVDETIHISSLDNRGFPLSDNISEDFKKIKELKNKDILT